MAELTSLVAVGKGGRLSRAQFLAIAWLRWRILANSFRRKGGKAELVGRILLLPLLAILALLPTLTAGFLAWACATRGNLGQISVVFWGTFALTQLLNINLGQPGTTFDPVELIRFPMAQRSYVLVRLTFGLLSPANVIVSLMSAAIFLGITIARPHLLPWTFAATVAFALTNVLFSRMIFAWVDRWLSTRRAREIFTGLIFTASLGFQYLNVTFSPGFNRGDRHVTAHNLRLFQTVFHQVHPWLRGLPPELGTAALRAAQSGRYGLSFGDSALILLYGATFLAVYALRMRSEYRGENLSDQANVVRKPVEQKLAAPISAPVKPHPVFASAGVASPPHRAFLPATFGPLLQKEILTLRRNTGMLYGVIAPTVMVFLFAGRLSLRGGSHWLLLIAAAYAMLGFAPMSYNSFGLEGPGAQFYFMAPLALREVFFAKNVLHFLLAAFELLVVISIVAYVAGRPHLLDVAFVLLWAAGTLLLNTTLGNLRSVSAPKKVNPGRSINRTQSQISAWIAIGILAGSAGLGAGLQLLAIYFHQRWLALAIILLFAVAAVVVYDQGLRGIEAYALDRRDSLFEELGKKT